MAAASIEEAAFRAASAAKPPAVPVSKTLMPLALRKDARAWGAVLLRAVWQDG